MRTTVESIAADTGQTSLLPEDTTEFDMTRWRKALKAAAKLIPIDPTTNLPQVGRDIKVCQPERNLVIHGYWSIDNKGGLHAYTYRRGKFEGANPMNFKRLESLNNEIVRMAQALQEYLKRRPAD